MANEYVNSKQYASWFSSMLLKGYYINKCKKISHSFEVLPYVRSPHKRYNEHWLFHDEGLDHIDTSPLIGRANKIGALGPQKVKANVSNCEQLL